MQHPYCFLPVLLGKPSSNHQPPHRHQNSPSLATPPHISIRSHRLRAATKTPRQRTMAEPRWSPDIAECNYDLPRIHIPTIPPPPPRIAPCTAGADPIIPAQRQTTCTLVCSRYLARGNVS